MESVIVDTGPLVALLDQRETAHEWVREQFAQMQKPLLTCEVVLAETAYLLLSRGMPRGRFFQLFRRGLVEVHFNLAAEWERIEALMAAYHDTPMSLADACVVRMCEQARSGTVFTLDRDFLIYRQHGKQEIPLLAPFG